jgi:hypothetical protein
LRFDVNSAASWELASTVPAKAGMLVVKDEPKGQIRMWAAALYVVGGTITGFGLSMFGLRTRRQGGHLRCILWALAAGVLWPVLLVGVVEMMVIVGALKWSGRLTPLHVPPAEEVWLDENVSVPV